MNGCLGFASNVSFCECLLYDWVGVHYVWINGLMSSSIMQWLCNTWNIGYILVSLLRKKLKRNFSLWSDRKSGEEWARLWEQWWCTGRKYDGNHTAPSSSSSFSSSSFFSQNSKPLKIANSLCRVNPQNSPRARLFKWSQIPLGTANPARPPLNTPPTPHRQGFTVELSSLFLLKYTATAFNQAPEVCWGE